MDMIVSFALQKKKPNLRQRYDDKEDSQHFFFKVMLNYIGGKSLWEIQNGMGYNLETYQAIFHVLYHMHLVPNS